MSTAAFGYCATRRATPSLLSPHGHADYPGIAVVRPDARWPFYVVRPGVGETVVAKGGEQIYRTDACDGGSVLVVQLEAGDRATLLEQDGARGLWRIECHPLRALSA